MAGRTTDGTAAQIDSSCKITIAYAQSIHLRDTSAKHGVVFGIASVKDMAGSIRQTRQ